MPLLHADCPSPACSQLMAVERALPDLPQRCPACATRVCAAMVPHCMAPRGNLRRPEGGLAGLGLACWLLGMDWHDMDAIARQVMAWHGMARA